MPGSRDAFDDPEPIRILVVCAGNTCRSPAAKVAIEAAAAQRGLAVEVLSAGTVAVEGTEPSEMIVKVAAQRGLEITGVAHQVDAQDLARADIVLALDRAVEVFLGTLGDHKHEGLGLLRAYVGADDDEIADPWGRSEDGYARTLDLIMESAEAFVAALND